ncbi:MAG: hypothetical protein RSC11_07925 [Mucinivorans sp.]
MKTITATANQTIYDVALQHYGTTEAVGELLLNNPELVNDPAALSAQGIDYLADRGFYVDVPVLRGSKVNIDPQSPNMKKQITREITKEITTYGTQN